MCVQVVKVTNQQDLKNYKGYQDETFRGYELNQKHPAHPGCRNGTSTIFREKLGVLS